MRRNGLYSAMNTTPWVVVIAAADGGTQALLRVLASLPLDFPAALVVSMHADTRQSLVDATVMNEQAPSRFRLANEGDHLVSGSLFLAPAQGHLVIRADGHLGLDLGSKSPMLAADDLFVSAAKVYGQRTIGVILTGAGRDGSVGSTAIGKHGGTSIVQSPSDALVPGMPINAIVRDSPDHVVLLDEIGPLLQQLVAR